MRGFLISILILSVYRVQSQFEEYEEDNKLDDSVCSNGDLYVANPNDCAKYVKCNQGSKTISGYFKCNDGLLYEQEEGCIPTTYANCKYGPLATTPKAEQVDDIEAYKYGCRENKQSGYLSHPTDCSKYIECRLGGARIYTCLNKENFNVENQKCDANTVCVSNKNHPYTYLKSVPSEAIRQCINNLNANNYIAGYENSLGRVCKYVVCGDEPKLGECGEFALNTTSRSCDSNITCSANINQIGFLAILILSLVNLIF
jgi:hypothetical protein